MIIDCISDLHGFFPETKGGDLLIVAGDLTSTDSCEEYFNFCCWLHKQKYKKYIFIGGNHDNLLQSDNVFINGIDSTTYLCDSGAEFEGLKIWGSPWTLTFPGINPKASAFTGSEEDLKAKFSLIPSGIDILITHSPPHGVLDVVYKEYMCLPYGVCCGSHSLADELIRVRPKLHVFGHIHEGYGKTRPNLEPFNLPGYPIFVNCSHVDKKYNPMNKPIRIEV